MVGGDEYRRSIKGVMDVVGHDVYGARTLNQAAAFIEQYGPSLDAIIVDYDSVIINMHECLQMAPQVCLIIQSDLHRENTMPIAAVGTVLVSKRIEVSRIEEYLQQLVGLNQLDMMPA